MPLIAEPTLHSKYDIHVLRGQPLSLHRLIFATTGAAALQTNVFSEHRLLNRLPAAMFSPGVKGCASGLGIDPVILVRCCLGPEIVTVSSFD
jgi:hypothetical protein